MTNNQLTYWANIERERANRASEALQRQSINAQRYAANLNYAASMYNAQMHYSTQMASIASQEKRAENELQYRYDNMWFGKYGWSGLVGERLYKDSIGAAEDIQHRLQITGRDLYTPTWKEAADQLIQFKKHVPGETVTW